MGGAGDGAARLTVFGGLPRILRQDLPQFHFAASVFACPDEDGNGRGLHHRRGQEYQKRYGCLRWAGRLGPLVDRYDSSRDRQAF